MDLSISIDEAKSMSHLLWTLLCRSPVLKDMQMRGGWDVDGSLSPQEIVLFSEMNTSDNNIIFDVSVRYTMLQCTFNLRSINLKHEH